MFPLKRVDYIADPDKLVLTPTLRRDLVKGWVNRMVKTIKEASSASHWAAPILLMIILSYVVYNGQATTAEIKDLNRAITVLQTQKEEQEKSVERERQEKFQLTREQEAWRERLAREIMELKLITQNKINRN